MNENNLEKIINNIVGDAIVKEVMSLKLAVKLIETVEEKAAEDPVVKQKGHIAAFTMLLCIFLFVASGFAPFNKCFNIGVIGMLGAAIVLGTRCISVKKAYSDLPWDVLITIGGIGGLGTGLDVSGGGALIANGVLNLFGGKNASVVVLTIVIAVLTSVLTNFMSNNATAAMLSPIAIAMALGLGISPLPWVIVLQLAPTWQLQHRTEQLLTCRSYRQDISSLTSLKSADHCLSY